MKLSEITQDSYQLFASHASMMSVAINQALNGVKIWRGSRSGITTPYIRDSGKFNRSAANTANYVNTLVSNLPNWTNYPPRENSTIASFDKGRARQYAVDYTNVRTEREPFLVLPFGNPIIGICPSSDFFTGFRSSSKVGVPEINTYIESINFNYGKLLGKSGKDLFLNSNSGKELIKQLASMDMTRLSNEKKETLFKLVTGTYYSKDIPDIFKKLITYPNVLSFIQDLLDPIANEFQAVKLSDITPDMLNYNEVWMSSKVMFITASQFEKYLDKFQSQLKV